MSEKKKTGGLAGVTAGKTAICSVGHPEIGLCYRGYSFRDLAERSTFEEVAHLLLYGRLPRREELEEYGRRLAARRGLSGPMKRLLEQLPAEAHPMEVLRTGCSALGCFEPEGSFEGQHRVADQLLAVFPSMLLYWHHYHRTGRPIDTATDEPSLAGHFLRLLHGRRPSESQRRAMDVSLILYAEHELAASTFAARLVASTRADFHSAITAAIGALRGPLHGGANEAALALLRRFRDPHEAERGVIEALASKERIMGFGHPVYVDGDPRSDVIKAWARQLAGECGKQPLYAIAERIEAVMRREKDLFPNLDFYTAVVYDCLDIPVPMFTPVFVCSRIAGWAAHVVEQRLDAKILRPTAEYVGAGPRPYVPIDERVGPEFFAAVAGEGRR
jgi:2-methylcitrate synthase